MPGPAARLVTSGGLPVNIATSGATPLTLSDTTGLAVRVSDLGAPFILEGLAAFETETTDLTARMTVPPSLSQQYHMNVLIKALKDAGVWSLLVGLYVPAMTTQQAALLNWKGASFGLSVSSPIAPTFTANRGFKGNGSSSFLTTGATLAGMSIAQNSVSLGMFLTGSGTPGSGLCGCRNNSGTALGCYMTASTTTVTARINNTSTSTSVAAAGPVRRSISANRSASNAMQIRQNGVTIATDTVASSGVSAGNVVFLGVYTNASTAVTVFTGEEMAAGWIGSSLNDAQALALYNALNAYLTANRV